MSKPCLPHPIPESYDGANDDAVVEAGPSTMRDTAFMSTIQYQGESSSTPLRSVSVSPLTQPPQPLTATTPSGISNQEIQLPQTSTGTSGATARTPIIPTTIHEIGQGGDRNGGQGTEMRRRSGIRRIEEGKVSTEPRSRCGQTETKCSPEFKSGCLFIALLVAFALGFMFIYSSVHHYSRKLE
ncbi:hypothetical protein B0T25DRAFT_343668 [Lasiosphaeria hispida]|uniref:Uncharacterized protein n=1 Tax=Lasiosphaeria hispida TaxID=260671 RepID=A0AAJ0H6C5_9PEZI|nr:hypothetical protein B0T25DRAFT_343668 [Lasiosphaeria hispida]